ncbi:HlyC/CorC family transporter [Roseinatronobacter bogoriensis]|uniref:HlyC/CorC family transporter n=1 Tax=Roseinatronobacter bogoriensis subsp. barguzinensis TaxID=441209 RepID=A0A2K8KMT7_9RHOB|nr:MULTISPECIES: HlyC/CorC family transporter [Rhodobaca]ATX67890.1 HlyC/CorC family transporter [Rhodobaca barguzinensis]
MGEYAAYLDTAFWVSVGAILLLLVISGFFSGSETALTASSRGKLKAQADKGATGARKALALTDDSERMIGAILLGNNMVNILAASLATALFTRIFGESGVALATLVMTLLVLVFAEVLPKTYAISNPESAATRVAPLLRWVVAIFSPIVSVVRFVVRRVLALFGVTIDPDSQIMSVHEEIAGTLALGHSTGSVEKEHRDRLLGALDLSERTVEEIMRHRSQVETVNVDDPIEEVIAQCINSPHSRLPMYREDPENIIGILYVRDLVREMHGLVTQAGGSYSAIAKLDLDALARPPYFVPETTPLDEQMQEFLRLRRHFALVVDEYGALHGLITLEDILEEIVGEIEDEYDTTHAPEVERGEGGEVLVDGAMTIRDLNRTLDWSLPDEEAVTVAGLVIHEAQSIPEEGQVFSFHGCRFKVLARDGNRITRISLRRSDDQSGTS